MNPHDSLVLIWFAISGLVAIFSSMALYLWLLRQGAGVVTGLSGIPGFLELRYRDHCRRTGRSANRMLFVRAIIYANAVGATVAVIPVLSSRMH